MVGFLAGVPLAIILQGITGPDATVGVRQQWSGDAEGPAQAMVAATAAMIWMDIVS